MRVVKIQLHLCIGSYWLETRRHKVKLWCFGVFWQFFKLSVNFISFQEVIFWYVCVYTVYAFLRDDHVFQWSQSERGGREGQCPQVCVGRSQWCLESGQHGLHLRAGPDWWVTLVWLFERNSLDCYEYPLVICLCVLQPTNIKYRKLVN